MDKLKFAVVGVGRMGSVHAAHLLRGRVKGAELSAVVDLSEEAQARWEGKVPTFALYEEMTERVKPDAVIIAVPHYAHLTIARFFAERGIHILIEKPVSVTTAEAEGFNRFLKESKLATKKNPQTAVAVMYNQRTNPVYCAAKKLLDGGAVGEIRRVNFVVTGWYRSQAYYDQGGWRGTWSGEGGGILINQCVHQLDILQWLVGMPDKIFARAATVGRKITTENAVTAIFEYKNGAKCTFSASAHELNGVNRLEIAGDKGRLVIGETKLTHYFWDKSEPDVNRDTVKGYGSAKKHKRVYRYGPRRISDLIFGQQLRIVKNFTRHILQGEPLISPAEEGIRALSLINGIYLSAWTGEAVGLPIDGGLYEKLLKDKIKKEQVNV
ncbi:MAG: Gfo/Idh/MocA family oxidoreductase [Clostridiales bacterium]|jgi:predicted dehydrogenase|nr:Gfo/Idh/MocA family oxidoreductase [Clostridiales bacterium]